MPHDPFHPQRLYVTCPLSSLAHFNPDNTGNMSLTKYWYQSTTSHCVTSHTTDLPYLLEFKTRFFSLQSGAWIREVVLNSHMKHQTGLRWTRLLWTGAKPRPALPNCQVRYTLFWDITQRRDVMPCRRYGTSYQSHLQGSRNAKERTLHDWS
jgi:hypothetical protein